LRVKQDQKNKKKFPLHSIFLKTQPIHAQSKIIGLDNQMVATIPLKVETQSMTTNLPKLQKSRQSKKKAFNQIQIEKTETSIQNLQPNLPITMDQKNLSQKFFQSSNSISSQIGLLESSHQNLLNEKLSSIEKTEMQPITNQPKPKSKKTRISKSNSPNQKEKENHQNLIQPNQQDSIQSQLEEEFCLL